MPMRAMSGESPRDVPHVLSNGHILILENKITRIPLFNIKHISNRYTTTPFKRKLPGLSRITQLYLSSFLRDPGNQPKRNAMRTKFIIAMFLFTITGLSNSLSANELDLLGSCKSPLGGLQVLGLYIGQFMASFAFPGAWTTLTFRQVYKMAPLVALDVISNTAYWTSIISIGSGLTTVVYSTIVVFSAIFQFCIFGKRLTISQLISVFGIIAFVSLASVDEVRNNSGPFDLILGIALAAASAAGLGFEFVISNRLLQGNNTDWSSGADGILVHEQMDENGGRILHVDDSTDDEKTSTTSPSSADYTPMVSNQTSVSEAFLTEPQLQAILSLGLIPSLIYVLVYTVPHRHELIIQPLHNAPYKSGASWAYVWGMYVIFVLSNGIHQSSLYHVLGEGPISAVTTGVSKGLQAVLVFMGSAFIYCHVQESQCLTSYKLVGVAGVVFFVIWYSIGDQCVNRYWDSRVALEKDKLLQEGSHENKALKHPL
ncbi:hypothetical protein AAMO2058_000443300 [Amorphochlora amoebiformis]